MAFAATTIWEVQAGGDDTNNGGAFDPVSGTPGTDYSVQAAPQISYTDMVIDGGTATKFTSAANPVTSAHVGNFVSVTSGTGFTLQRLQILSQAGGLATCDKSIGTLASTGGHGGLGGALATPTKVQALAVAQNIVYIKIGTYTVTARYNPASNVVTIGYSTNRTPFNTDSRPTIRIGANSIQGIYPNGVSVLMNLIVDNVGGFTGTTGIMFDNGSGLAYNCKVSAVATGFNFNFQQSQTVFCEAVSCTGVSFVNNSGGQFIFCVARSGGSHGFSLLAAGSARGCVAYACAGTGFNLATTSSFADHCVAYGMTGASGHGFGVSALVSTASNCVAVNNAQRGFSTGGSTVNTDGARQVLLLGCAAYGNTVANFDTGFSTSINNIASVALTGDPFTNASGLDFSLNSTAGAGAALKASGYPATFPGLTGTSSPDIGAFQHADAAVLAQAAIADVRRGTVYATGTLTGTAYIPVAADVRSGTNVDATMGSLAVPAASNVRHGISVDNTTGTMTAGTLGLSAGDLRSGTVVDTTTGTCAVPTAANVRLGTSVDATTGTLVVPAAANVRLGTSVDATTGTAAIPTAANVRSGTATDATTGTLAVPIASNVKHGISVDNTTGTLTAATLGLSAADLRLSTVVDTTTGTCAVPAAGDVRLGTAVGATTGSLVATTTGGGIVQG